VTCMFPTLRTTRSLPAESFFAGAEVELADEAAGLGLAGCWAQLTAATKQTKREWGMKDARIKFT